MSKRKRRGEREKVREGKGMYIINPGLTKSDAVGCYLGKRDVSPWLDRMSSRNMC